MTPLLKKLNYKEQREVLLLNLPKEQKYIIKDFGEYANVVLETSQAAEIEFALIFCTKKDEVDTYTNKVIPKLAEDGTIWYAYPKGTSKKYKCDFNRDTGWNVLGEHGFEGVRIVAIDEDWSALRFRKAKHIKTMTRSFAMSEEGKSKVAQTKK